ncbi:DNA repair protein RecO [Polaromonas naphthalenivorans]|uniref:DNA repair protein RecO n=1 Tax=Polaromonas naphthalenivorans (strain CJ2) TaxID=365044 RepID=RECO_POLNA|nr:DNA repair protein RecO [Polaromonas naphthalenivorans]A1VRT0.1 RecName: Full=DNA repair protein RecO; AltName: Full=Recombination protein O [Polaromonas naphthalenivorans CJ2]ABM38358.1 DNA repair protein RecO [Polaromonas naphthalenivorans CJ2]
MASQRISNEPAYVLHRYDWSESSLILDVFTRHHGRVALVARGAKKPSSSFRPILLPLQPLHVAFGGDAEIRNLKSAEWQGGHVMPSGDALLSGYYLNELLMRLLARDDPHPLLFDAYAATVQLLASQNPDTLQLALRAFELRLLQGIGLLPRLDAETATLTPLAPHQRYVLVAEAGLRQAHDDDRFSLSGAQWQALQQALGGKSLFSDTLQACVACANELKIQLRALLHYHCGVRVLKTRQMMMDLQAL